jgi:hypothetical protein
VPHSSKACSRDAKHDLDAGEPLLHTQSHAHVVGGHLQRSGNVRIQLCSVRQTHSCVKQFVKLVCTRCHASAALY